MTLLSPEQPVQGAELGALLSGPPTPGGFQAAAWPGNVALLGTLGLKTALLLSPLLLARANSGGARLLGLLGALGGLGALAGRGAVALPPFTGPRLPGMTACRTVTLGGETVYVETGGEGSPVVLVHPIGGGNSSHLWRENTAALARHHRVYVFDWPGFARSGARAGAYTAELYVRVLRAFLREVVGQPAAVITASYGADYAVRVAAETPELITRLLLIGPTGYTFNRQSRERRRGLLRRVSERNTRLYTAFSQTPLGALAYQALKTEASLDFFLRNFIYLDPARATPELNAIYRQNLTGPHKGSAPWSFFSGYLDQPTPDYWPRTTQPTRLVWGRHDVFTPVQDARGLLEDRPVPLHLFGARGLPQDECANEFNALALRFLGERA